MRYTKSHPYRKLLILGNDRINLDGSVGSKILETEVQTFKPKATKAKPQDTKNIENKSEQLTS
jgi:hypothetical protein